MKKTTHKHAELSTSTVTINRREIYKQARAYAKKHVRKFSLLLLIVIILNIVNSWFDPESQKTMTQEMTTLTTILSLILSLASAWLSMGFISISLRLFDEKAVSFSDGIIDLKTTFKTFVAKVITTIFTLVGFIFLIVPGIIIQTRLFCDYINLG